MGNHCDEQIGEIPLELKPDLDPELVEEFINDAREQLHNIEQGTLALEKNAADHEVIHSLFRAFHTFKGNAGFLDFAAISQLAHALESLLDGARENRLQINSVIIEIILKSRDTLQKFVDEIEAQITGKKPRAIVNIPTAALKVATKFMLNGEGHGAAMAHPPEPEKPAPTAPAPKARVEAAKEIPAPRPTTEQPVAPKSSYQSGAALHVVKVATSKLDSLVDLAGELLIAQSLVVQNVNSPAVSRHMLARNLDQLSRISKELQRMAMSMRMVPIRATFHKMQRLVRDIAAKQQKHVHFILEGEDTEVDRTLAEKLADPLDAHDPQRGRPRHRAARQARGHRQAPDRRDPSARLPQERHHHHRSRGRRRGPQSRAHRRKGDRQRLAAPRRYARRPRHPQLHPPARLFHRGRCHLHLRPWRRHGRGAKKHRAASRQDRHQVDPGPRHDLHHPAAAHPRHHRRPDHPRRRPALRPAHRVGARVLSPQVLQRHLAA